MSKEVLSDLSVKGTLSIPKTGGGEMNVRQEIEGKQATLSFDSTPTASSTNPVTSGGVKTALDAKQDILTFATEEEAIGGSNNTTLMTPLRVDQAFNEKFKVIDGVLNVFENGEWVEYVPK